MKWQMAVAGIVLSLLGAIFLIPPFWWLIFLAFLVWRSGENYFLELAFWLGLWQGWWREVGWGWLFLYVAVTYLGLWLWGKKKNSSWRIS